MAEFGEWTVVERKTRRPLLHLALGLLQGMSGLGPENASKVTWTLRHNETGQVRKVTARSEREAVDKVARGDFDAGY